MMGQSRQYDRRLFAASASAQSQNWRALRRLEDMPLVAAGMLQRRIVDALADFGATQLEMRVTSERVWRIIRQQV